MGGRAINLISLIVPRLVGAGLFGLAGLLIGSAIEGALTSPSFIPGGLSGVLVGVLIGGTLFPYIVMLPARKVSQLLREVPANRIISIVVGLTLGLIVAALISVPLTRIPDPYGVWIPIGASVVFGALGIIIMLSREQDIAQVFPQGTLPRVGVGSSSAKVVVDTSAIIDGRIADISLTGFLGGTLIIPRFVLDELRHIADASDPLRRNRGRRGLEVLNHIRKDGGSHVQIVDVDRWEEMEVDSKLVMLARSLGTPIVTTDFNLNRVAEIQGVPVLNVNELANAMKSAVIPGEEIEIQVIQEGRELGQGVGFLDDGTMVVVEDGRRYMGTAVEVVATRVLQTAAGRLIFTQLKGR